MKIAIPVVNGQLNGHFGRTQAFEIIDVDPQTRQITAQRTMPLPPHAGCGALPDALKSEGVDTVICGGVGEGARAKMHAAQLTLVAGAKAAPVLEIVNAYLAGTLQTDGGACNHTHGHGHAHHQGTCHGHHHGRGHRGGGAGGGRPRQGRKQGGTTNAAG